MRRDLTGECTPTAVDVLLYVVVVVDKEVVVSVVPAFFLLVGAVAAAWTDPRLAHVGPALAAWLLWFVFGMALLIVTFIDLDFWIIPDAIVLPLGAVGLLVAALDPSILQVTLVDGAIAAALGFSLLAGLRWVYLKRRGIEALGLAAATRRRGDRSCRRSTSPIPSAWDATATAPRRRAGSRPRAWRRWISTTRPSDNGSCWPQASWACF